LGPDPVWTLRRKFLALVRLDLRPLGLPMVRNGSRSTAATTTTTTTRRERETAIAHKEDRERKAIKRKPCQRDREKASKRLTQRCFCSCC
jgi:hypothetical protein